MMGQQLGAGRYGGKERSGRAAGSNDDLGAGFRVEVIHSGLQQIGLLGADIDAM